MGKQSLATCQGILFPPMEQCFTPPNRLTMQVRYYLARITGTAVKVVFTAGLPMPPHHSETPASLSWGLLAFPSHVPALGLWNLDRSIC